MKIKSFFFNYSLQIVATIIGAICTGFMAYYNWPIAIAQGILLMAIAIGGIVRSKMASKRLKRTVELTSKYLSYDGDNNSLQGFPFATSVVQLSGKIVWCNNLFYSYFVGGELLGDDNIEEFTGEITVDEIANLDTVSVDYNGRRYSVYSNKLDYKDDNELYIIYFVDDTELKNTFDEYLLSKPTVLHAVVDNADEILQDYKDSEVAVINGKVEKIIESWVAMFPCVMRKMSNGRYFIISEERGLRQMVDQKFKILDEVRAFEYEEKVIGITLSIGAGRGETMLECDDSARQSLDMAQSRGGDQVAIKTKGDYEFFGGVSSGIEKKTKTKTRIISAALAELIESSDNVLIMGHCYSDLDSIGSAVGVYCAANSLNTDAHIVVCKEKSLCESVIKHLENNNMGGIFVEPEKAMEMVSKKTLLVVVDTHRADFLEYRPIYDKVQRVVVVDHHRKTVDYIDNAVLFYNEPTSSSASEMVTEMLQYITNKSNVTKPVAEALLAGIMLDTRNFVLRTGVRTFEAAAYLKSRGADTVCVKQLFSNSMDNYRQRNAIIGTSTTYENCAIAIAPDNIDNIRVVASQVADELLNISGIRSSYVIFKTNGAVNISARSMGEMNVQIIMEKLGGGGHQTMAAAQLPKNTVEETLVELKGALDYYFDFYK